MMASNEEFSEGRQPCAAFVPKKDSNGNGEWDNRHECFKRCGFLVSFCQTCNKDHHQGGYEACAPLCAKEQS